VARFEALGDTMPAGTPEEIATTTLYSFLVSPSFILQTELDPTQEGTAIKLSGQEVAARLSFFIWGSVPDDALNQAADAGMLDTKEGILSQAQRMIMDRSKTGPVVSLFHRVTWALDNNTPTSHWWKIDHDGNADYNAAAKTSYQDEISKFFEEVAFTSGTFKDLFLSPIAFVNQDNAAIYGLAKASYGTDLMKVTLDANQRPGFMTRAGFLSSYSHPDSTSPILRGAFVTVNFIGVDPGPPMIDPSQVMPPTGTFTTERDYVVALTSQSPSCQGCHIPFINPPGFVLENYDSIGKWQDTDPRGGAINPVADVTFDSAQPAKTIHNAVELMTEIANTPKARQMYAEKWVTFATGRQPNPNDTCIVDDLNTKLSTDGYSLLTLLADLTQSDSFRLRVRATP
jgi:hypothetical protein